MPVDHRLRSLSFGPAGCLRRNGRHDNTVPVLDQRMAHEVKLRGLALDFCGSFASGSVLLSCVSLARFSWKSRVPLRPGGGRLPSPTNQRNSETAKQQVCGMLLAGEKFNSLLGAHRLPAYAQRLQSAVLADVTGKGR
jgi:hypothetical protein